MARFVKDVILALFFVALALGLLVYFVPGHEGDSRGRVTVILLDDLVVKIDTYRAEHQGRLPDTLDALLDDHPAQVGHGPYARRADLVDPWGRRFYYRASEDGHAFLLFSLGADGLPGGKDRQNDVEVHVPETASFD